jgi:hypothetical protein
MYTLYTQISRFKATFLALSVSLSICSLPPPFLSQRARARPSSLHFALSEFYVSVSLYVCTADNNMSGYMSEWKSSSSSSQTGVHLHAAGITSKHFSFCLLCFLQSHKNPPHTHTPHTQLTRSICIPNMHFMQSHSFMCTNKRHRFLIVGPKATCALIPR